GAAGAGRRGRDIARADGNRLGARQSGDHVAHRRRQPARAARRRGGGRRQDARRRAQGAPGRADRRVSPGRRRPLSAVPAASDRARILVWICVLIAINQLGFGAVVAVLALYARSFGVSQSAIGLAIAIYGFARFAVAMPAGRLADRAGRRAGLALGGVVSAAGNLVCAYAPTFPLFILGRFVAGAGAALVLIAGTVILADITTPADRGRTMAIYQGVFLFAVGVGPVPGGMLAERFGLVAPFMVYTVTGLVAAALTWFVIPETRRALAATAVAAAAPPGFAVQVRLLTAQIGFAVV